MYEKLSAKQQCGLIYGFKLRIIKNILWGLDQGETNPFSGAEADQLRSICDNATTRAKTVLEETQRRLADTEASRRPEAEHRQYNGK